jgi:uncharacterized protein GlcG (DUF336 family)
LSRYALRPRRTGTTVARAANRSAARAAAGTPLRHANKLVEGGKLIGAIGWSGGTGDQDALICKIGADMIR